MKEFVKYNFKIKVIPNVLKNNTSFSLDSNLDFIDSFQILTSSLDSSVENFD